MRHHGRISRGWRVLALLAAGVWGAFGCQPQQHQFLASYERGDFINAATIAKRLAENSEHRDRVLYRLEEGTVHRAAGQFADSNLALDEADDMAAEFDEKPDVSISQETLATLTNLASLDYKGYCYDRVMMNTYKVLNHLESGDPDKARIEINRLYEQQQQAVERYAKKIEKSEEELRQIGDRSDQSYDLSRAEQDPKVRQATEAALEGVKDMSAYELYVNPFAEYVKALYYLGAAADAAEREKAVTAFRRLAGMIHNDYVLQDLQTAEDAANGGEVPPTTYVIFETGMAPQRTAFRIDVPVFVASVATRRDLGVDYVGASIPVLQWGPMGPDYLEAVAAGTAYRTMMVCDMDAVIGREFRNELPTVIAKTLISAGLKAAAAYGINQATRKDSTARIISGLATVVWQVGTNQADLRTWRTLPKQFQIARLPTPPDRRVQLAVPGSAPTVVELSQGTINVIYVKSVSPIVPLAIRQFTIKGPQP